MSSVIEAMIIERVYTLEEFHHEFPTSAISFLPSVRILHGQESTQVKPLLLLTGLTGITLLSFAVSIE